MTPDATLAAGARLRTQVLGAERVALALGMTGALGEELLAALVGSPNYRLIHVAVKQSIVSAASKFHPWVVGSSPVTADDAYVCVTDDAVPLPHNTPLQRYGSEQLLAAARAARDAKVRRLVVIAPLSALLQLNAASHSVSSEQELALVEMRFETLVIVRPTRDEIEDSRAPWLQRTVTSLGRSVLEIMLPAQVQALRPKTAALAILTAVERMSPGVNVIGARELADIVAETMPALLPKRPKLR
jgi:hypothetical protein